MLVEKIENLPVVVAASWPLTGACDAPPTPSPVALFSWEITVAADVDKFSDNELELSSAMAGVSSASAFLVGGRFLAFLPLPDGVFYL